MDYGQSRYDGEVWQWLDPPTERSNHFGPEYKELDNQKERFESTTRMSTARVGANGGEVQEQAAVFGVAAEQP